jgi:hypothetical protein
LLTISPQNTLGGDYGHRELGGAEETGMDLFFPLFHHKECLNELVVILRFEQGGRHCRVSDRFGFLISSKSDEISI